MEDQDDLYEFAVQNDLVECGFCGMPVKEFR